MLDNFDALTKTDLDRSCLGASNNHAKAFAAAPTREKYDIFNLRAVGSSPSTKWSLLSLNVRAVGPKLSTLNSRSKELLHLFDHTTHTEV
jgi:hypothetical protein